MFFSQTLEGKEKGLEEANSSLKYELSLQPDPMSLEIRAKLWPQTTLQRCVVSTAALTYRP